MAENVTIARPYADAAFELARGAGALGPWSEALDRLAAVAADPTLFDAALARWGLSPDPLTLDLLASARLGPDHL